MFSANDGWASGGVAGGNDHILLTGDGGNTWQDRTPPEAAAPPGQHKGVHTFFLDNERGWAVYYPTSDFQIEKPRSWQTVDGGLNWVAGQPLDIGGLEGYFLPSDLHFVNDKQGWMLVHLGGGMNHDYIALYSSQDGGNKWQRLLDPFSDSSIQSCTKTALVFTDAQNGWLSGDCNGVAPGAWLFHSINGGVSWQPVDLPEPDDTPGLFTAMESACGTYYPTFTDSLNGRLVVRCTRFDKDSAQKLNYLYTTRTGGASWSISAYPGGLPMMVSPQSGLALGEAIFRTDDGGASWQMASQPGWRARYTYRDGILWAIVADEQATKLYRSRDAGANWMEINPLTDLP
jgi:photosystem II stability/assembly factor-like uncharacterized protein